MSVEFGRRGLSTPEAASGSAGGGSTDPGFGADWSLQDVMRLGVHLAAAGLIGFGVILWIASQWGDISRFGRFAIVGGGLAAALLVSLVNAVRVPGLLVSFLGIGGLFALIGQTYQTGADPWQLFAIWAAIGVPLALASRSDVLWLAWGVVAMSAVALWVATFGGISMWGPDREALLWGWLLAAGITALLSPYARLQGWIGETKWSYRLMALITMVVITQGGVTDMVVGSVTARMYWIALVALAGYGVLLARTREHFDILLVSALGLCLDTLLIMGFSRIVVKGGGTHFGIFMLIGLVGAALVAGTGALILNLARKHTGGGSDLEVLKGREWPVILMTGIGALLTSIPLGSAFGTLFGMFLISGVGPYIMGAAFVAGAVKAIRGHSQTSFAHQLAAIGLTFGVCLITYGVARDVGRWPVTVAFVLLVLVSGIAAVVGRSWTAALLGAAAGVFLTMFVNGLLITKLYDVASLYVVNGIGWSISLAAFAGLLFWNDSASPLASSGIALRGLADALSRYIGGGIVVGLIGTVFSAGPTFLLSGALNGGFMRHPPEVIPLSLHFISPVSAVLAVVGLAVLFANRPALATPLGLGAAAITALLAAVIAPLGAPVLVIALALTTDRRLIAIGGLVTALWFVGSFYYWLGWPLASKAALMLVAGVVLALLSLATGLKRPTLHLGGGRAAPAGLARGLIVAAGLVTGFLAFQSIKGNEQILATGREIYLALAPVDPRSLIQGDYMRLNFAVPAESRKLVSGSLLGTRRWAVATVDANKLAMIERVVAEEPAAGQGQLVFPLRLKDRRWIVGTDAWFFKEGTAERWQGARYGVFRVGPGGTALLVGLLDKDMQPIK